MIPARINIRLVFLLSLAFILFTVIGTLSHEAGHLLMAKAKGYDARMNYGHTYWRGKYLNELLNEYEKNISKPGIKQKYDELKESRLRDSLQFAAGGPLQTMLTGTLGLILILWQRKKFYQAQELSFMQWILVFICLFWLRQLFNFTGQTLAYFRYGLITSRSDEIGIASRLGWPKLSVSALTAAIAAGILCFVIFRIVPPSQRLSFIIAGLIGGLLGFYLWLYLIGPVIMP